MENMGKDRQTLNDFLEEAELQQYSELFRDVLKISKISQLKFVLSEDLDQIGLSKPEQRRYKKIFSKYFPNPYIDKLKKLLSSHKKQEPYSQGHSSIQMEMQPFNDTNIKVPKKHIISIEDITITKELGKGQFGVVQQGTWSTGNQRLPVAIKCLGQERMTSNSAEFLKEAAVMHSIENPNIVRLYGVVLHSDSLMLVTELAPLRSLLECLREVSIRSYFSVPTLCSFAEQICEGMSYLENKRLIHRDLAARNILVFTKYKVKISDFGLSRALGVGKDYYQTNYNVNLKLPVAWCAPECILYLRFTSASDVWAFGVCLWEMFTYGFQPWAGFSGHQILDNIDYPNSQRLDRPLCCPKPYYATMLECWTHLPSQRPKFKELEAKLRSIRPQMVKTRSDFQVPEGGRPSNYLHYNAGEVITVLGQEQNLWYGVTSSGTCGVFDPGDTMPYDPPDKCLTSVPSLSPNSTRHSARSIRSTLLRCDVKRHTYTSKKTLLRSMISSPQGDVKHTGHVGLDGAYFGDISFLDPAGCPPRQIVTPYKPSEDLEQVPLINPNSPSHLSSSSGTTPYPMLTSIKSEKIDCDDISGFRKSNQKSHPEPPTVASRGAVQKVKYATLDRACNDDPGEGCSAMDDVHEYHEISDDANESNSAKSVTKQEDLHIDKDSADFSESLIGEMESLFRNLDAPGRHDEPSTSAKNPEAPPPEIKPREHTLPKSERKLRLSPTSTMKPMSAHDEKTLNIAVALANEITSKSMNDLGMDKTKYSPKFSFKFPHLSLQTHGHHSHEPEKEKETTVKHERRNFSEEAKSVPDIQSTLTAESKMAYTSLIEEPTPSTSLMSHFAKDSMIKPGNHLHSLQRDIHWGNNNKYNFNRRLEFQKYPENPIPLPPRSTKPKLIDKPRHIRKYPLKIPGEPKPTLESSEPPPIIYQNTTHPLKRGPVSVVISADVHDGPEPSKRGTNPFSNGPRTVPNPPRVYDLAIPGTSSPNPFTYTFHDVDDTDLEMDIDIGDEESDDELAEASGLVKDFKDHVSVEDLLEFADLKPCGRQRGVESDEVRLMRKVFNKQVVPKECLEALELSDWNIHNAIKLVRVSVSVGTEVTLETIRLELDKAKGDITKASAVLSKQKT